MNGTATQVRIFFGTDLKVVVIYDDFNFAARVTTLLERVAVRTEEAIKWDVRPWRLDMLKKPYMGDTAIAEAGDADLIVFALSENHPVPDELPGWLENWEARRQIQDAAVMLLCLNEDAASSPLWNQLERFTKSHGVAFLGGHSLWDEEDSMHFIQRRQSSGWFATSAVEAFANRSRPPQHWQHWGINE